MNNSELVKKVPWWRFPLAILAFILIYLLLPAIIGLALELTNLFTPEYYKSSYIWRFVLSDVLGAASAFWIMNVILSKRAAIFQTVFAGIVTMYSIFVAIWNWVSNISTLEQFVGMLSIGVTSIVFAVINGRKIVSPKKV